MTRDVIRPDNYRRKLRLLQPVLNARALLSDADKVGEYYYARNRFYLAVAWASSQANVTVATIKHWIRRYDRGEIF
jgi:hypothetical protein